MPMVRSTVRLSPSDGMLWNTSGKEESFSFQKSLQLVTLSCILQWFCHPHCGRKQLWFRGSWLASGTERKSQLTARTPRRLLADRKYGSRKTGGDYRKTPACCKCHERGFHCLSLMIKNTGCRINRPELNPRFSAYSLCDLGQVT